MSGIKAVLVALAACVLCFVGGAIAGAVMQHGHDKAQAATDRAAQAQAAQVETQRRVDAQTDIANDAEKQRTQALGDAFAARAAAGSLRGQVARLTADAKHSATTDGGAAAGSALDLLANVFAQSDERAGELASYADAARIAGQQCERSYDALTAQAR